MLLSFFLKLSLKDTKITINLEIDLFYFSTFRQSLVANPTNLRCIKQILFLFLLTAGLLNQVLFLEILNHFVVTTTFSCSVPAAPQSTGICVLPPFWNKSLSANAGLKMLFLKVKNVLEKTLLLSFPLPVSLTWDHEVHSGHEEKPHSVTNSFYKRWSGNLSSIAEGQLHFMLLMYYFLFYYYRGSN